MVLRARVLPLYMFVPRLLTPSCHKAMCLLMCQSGMDHIMDRLMGSLMDSCIGHLMDYLMDSLMDQLMNHAMECLMDNPIHLMVPGINPLISLLTMAL